MLITVGKVSKDRVKPRPRPTQDNLHFFAAIKQFPLQIARHYVAGKINYKRRKLQPCCFVYAHRVFRFEYKTSINGNFEFHQASSIQSKSSFKIFVWITVKKDEINICMIIVVFVTIHLSIHLKKIPPNCM